jgi:hypothetical protein
MRHVTFPYPGSSALLGGQAVHIHQYNADGSVTVFRPAGPYRCQPADLTAVDPAEAVQTWIETMLDHHAPSTVRTAASTLYENFCRFAADLGLRAAEVPTREAFDEALQAHGCRKIRCYPRGKGGQSKFITLCFDTALHEAAARELAE